MDSRVQAESEFSGMLARLKEKHLTVARAHAEGDGTWVLAWGGWGVMREGRKGEG